jgi:vanadium chloroperoxidase
MIEENGWSRIWLGVHWFYDAFALTAADKPDLSKKVGGARLGLDIAEDIFATGGGKAPIKSTV